MRVDLFCSARYVYARKSLTRSARTLRSLPNVAFETALMFGFTTMVLSRLLKEDRLILQRWSFPVFSKKDRVILQRWSFLVF